jgi:hypothetical protein
MKRTNPEDVVKDAANPTQFGPPLVSPGVTDPAALKYAQQITERKGLPKFAPPVAGGPGPMMPRLDAPVMEGLTMAEQAMMHRANEQPPQPAGQIPRGGMFQETADQRGQVQQQPHVPGLSRPPGILSTDILPPEAMQDPNFREGHGSRYAQSQPELAYKYGVLRGSPPVRVAPQQLQVAQPGLSDKTLAGLQALQQAQAGAPPHPLLDNEDKRIEREAAAGSGGAAGRLAGGDGATAPMMSAAAALEAAKKMDDFDFNAFRERMMKDLLNNEEQRDLIEGRCTPLSLEQLVTKGYVTQRVPIVTDKFEPEFQSMSGEEDLAIKRLIMVESKALEVSDRYLLDKFSIMSIVLGVRSINGTLLPDHRNTEGRFDDEKFWAKFNFLTRYPFHMLASIGVNYYWFDIRVRKLFVAEKLGNG